MSEEIKNEQALEVLNKELEKKKPTKKTSVPKYIQRHKELCKELHDTFKKKDHDYNGAFHKSIKEWGLSAAAVRISDKYNRITSLLKNNDPKVNESLEDSLKDLANYCLMVCLEIEGDKKNG